MAYSDLMLNKPISVAELSSVLGTANLDVGTLCLSSNICIFAKYKPIKYISHSELAAEVFAAQNYGLSIPTTTTPPAATQAPNALFSLGNWSYIRPTGSSYPYRMLDFNGYYSDAPGAIFQQSVGTSLIIDRINPAGVNTFVPIYLYQKSGINADKTFKQATDYPYDTIYGRTQDQMAASVGSEDISIRNLNLYDNDVTTHLGVVVFNNSGVYQGEVWTSRALAIGDTSYLEMHRVNVGSIQLATGSYKGIVCARLKPESGNVVYCKSHDFNANYPSKISITVKDGSDYPRTAQGLGETTTATPVTSLTSTKWTIYLTVRVRNNGGRSWSATKNNFLCNLSVSGTKKTSEEASPVSFSYDRVLRPVYPSGSTITIASGGYADIVFQINSLWDGTAQILYSGSLTIAITSLSYNYIELGTSGLERTLMVNYG